MNCLYCNQNIATQFKETSFDCRNHDGWDVTFAIYNSINSVDYKEDTLYRVSLASNNDCYLIHLDILNQSTQFLKRKGCNERYNHLILLPELKLITPDNASQWMERILNLKAFS